MSATVYSATVKPYRVVRVCEAWEVPLSSFHDRKNRQLESPSQLKRGPLN